MKRFFSLLLSIYIITLTLSPCVDHHPDASCNGITVVSVNDVTSHQEDLDSCSPFCTCSCCGLSVDVAPTVIIPGIHIGYCTLTCFCNTQLVSSFSFSIWEPPKSIFA